MTREEKQKAIDALKISAPVMAVTQEEFNDYIQTLNQVMDWLEQEPKWIPVSERLPEKNMPCLVSTGKLCLTQIAIYSDLMGTIDHRIFYQGDYGHENFVDITQYVIAWMPLPKPYEPQESEG